MLLATLSWLSEVPSARHSVQGLRITACLNYCTELDFVKRLPLRFSSERPFFQEEKYDHHCAIRRPVLHATPRSSSPTLAPPSLARHRRPDPLCRDRGCQRLATG